MMLTCTRKGTLLTNFFFDGARADLTKALSISPIFQVTHAFSMGGYNERGPVPSSYNFGAVYGSDRVSADDYFSGNADVFIVLLASWYRRCKGCHNASKHRLGTRPHLQSTRTTDTFRARQLRPT